MSSHWPSPGCHNRRMPWALLTVVDESSECRQVGQTNCDWSKWHSACRKVEYKGATRLHPESRHCRRRALAEIRHSFGHTASSASKRPFLLTVCDDTLYAGDAMNHVQLPWTIATADTAAPKMASESARINHTVQAQSESRNVTVRSNRDVVSAAINRPVSLVGTSTRRRLDKRSADSRSWVGK